MSKNKTMKPFQIPQKIALVFQQLNFGILFRLHEQIRITSSNLSSVVCLRKKSWILGSLILYSTIIVVSIRKHLNSRP